MNFFITLILSTFIAFAAYAQDKVVVKGENASSIIKYFTYGEHFKPAYYHPSEIYCKAKAPKSRDWGYANCTNRAWFDVNTKNAYYFTMALIKALPANLRNHLFLSKYEKDNKYVNGITLEALECTKGSSSSHDKCVLTIDINNQDRSKLNL